MASEMKLKGSKVTENLNPAEACLSLGGKYLTFQLGQEEYGLEILKVKEIIGLMDITYVPRTPPYIRGVINLRGKVIPVVDIRKKFGLENVEDTEKTCIIVVDVRQDKETIQLGILVDSVSEVLDINGNEIEETPSFGDEFEAGFILGMAKTRNSVKILLNIEEVLTSNGIIAMKESVLTTAAETAAQ